MIHVHGAGMAGLVAGARLRELGVSAEVHEKGTRAGGSMLLSSGVVWRHREWEDFRSECPGGDARLQRLIWERLDDALEWLRSLGASVVWEETGNERTVGKRFDPARLTDSLRARSVPVQLDEAGTNLTHTSQSDGIVLATGGFGGSPDLVARHIVPAAPLRLRANRWSDGDGLRFAQGHGAALTSGLDEFYGRNMPDAGWDETQLVSSSQLYARFARIFDEDGEEFFEGAQVSWSETNVVQATARRPGARAWYLLDAAGLAERVRDRPVADMVAAAPAEARPPLSTLPFDPPAGMVAAVRVAAAITHTIGGLRIDEQTRVLREDGTPVEGLCAAGVDAGGVATGGYASGLAHALVLGIVAAEQLAR